MIAVVSAISVPPRHRKDRKQRASGSNLVHARLRYRARNRHALANRVLHINGYMRVLDVFRLEAGGQEGLDLARGFAWRAVLPEAGISPRNGGTMLPSLSTCVSRLKSATG